MRVGGGAQGKGAWAGGAPQWAAAVGTAAAPRSAATPRYRTSLGCRALLCCYASLLGSTSAVPCCRVEATWHCRLAQWCIRPIQLELAPPRTKLRLGNSASFDGVSGPAASNRYCALLSTAFDCVVLRRT
eukprot:33853-Chlamydomonas_euryale.AAC.1